MGVFSSHESAVYDLQLFYHDIIDVTPDCIIYNDNSHMITMMFCDDMKKTFHNMIQKLIDNKSIIFLKHYDAVIYGISDGVHAASGSWHISDRTRNIYVNI